MGLHTKLFWLLLNIKLPNSTTIVVIKIQPNLLINGFWLY